MNREPENNTVAPTMLSDNAICATLSPEPGKATEVQDRCRSNGTIRAASTVKKMQEVPYP